MLRLNNIQCKEAFATRVCGWRVLFLVHNMRLLALLLQCFFVESHHCVHVARGGVLDEANNTESTLQKEATKKKTAAGLTLNSAAADRKCVPSTTFRNRSLTNCGPCRSSVQSPDPGELSPQSWEQGRCRAHCIPMPVRKRHAEVTT